MIVESSNPAHSLAGSAPCAQALQALDLLVVIDVAMTETARLADYVLPAPTQFEKYEATFYNFDFPRNIHHLRHPVRTAPEGLLAEPEIHARLVEAAGALTEQDYEPLRTAAEQGRAAYAAAFLAVDGRPHHAAPGAGARCTARWVRPCPRVRPRPRCSGQPPTSSPRATPPGSSRPATVRGSQLASSSSRRSCPAPMGW